MKYLKHVIDSFASTNIKNLVISSIIFIFIVPMDFSDKQCDTFKSCIKSAGFNLLSFIKDPCAALLPYINQNNWESGLFCIIDIGGTRSTCSILKMECGIISIIDSNTIYTFGGEYIDLLICDYLSDEFCRKNRGIEIKSNKKAIKKLLKSSKKARYCLSSSNSAHISIESLAEGIDFSTQLSLARYEMIISSKLSQYYNIFIFRLTNLINNTLSQHNINIEQLTGVIPCGGTYKVSSVKSLISGLFPESIIFDNISVDELIANGCGIELQNQLSSIGITKLDKLPILSKGIYLNSDNNKIEIIPSKTPLPILKEIVY